jgi:hypothetical protein
VFLKDPTTPQHKWCELFEWLLNAKKEKRGKPGPEAIPNLDKKCPACKLLKKLLDII